MNFETERLVKFFKLLGDGSKFRIISSLAEGEKCVCVIYSELALNQTLVSHHLSALKKEGLIIGRKEGKWVYYSLNKEYFAGIGRILPMFIGMENYGGSAAAETESADNYKSGKIIIRG